MSLRAILAIALMGAGLFVLCTATLGLFRFSDVLQRVHAGALADTMGLLLTLGGLALLFGATAQTVKLALVLVVLWVANPASSHLIVRMELVTGRNLDPDDGEEGTE